MGLKGCLLVLAPLRIFINIPRNCARNIWEQGIRKAVFLIFAGDSSMESHCYIKKRNHGSTLVLGELYRKLRLGFCQMQAEEEAL